MSGEVPSNGDPPRIDFDAIDPDDPFEIDDRNLPHLAKHPPFSEEDVYDAFDSDPIFFRAKPPAHWLMIANIPGDIVVVPRDAGHLATSDAPSWHLLSRRGPKVRIPTQQGLNHGR